MIRTTALDISYLVLTPFKITAGPRTESIENGTVPVKVPSKLVRMSGKISRKPYKYYILYIMNNTSTLRSSKISIGPPIFAKFQDRMSSKTKSLFWRVDLHAHLAHESKNWCALKIFHVPSPYMNKPCKGDVYTTGKISMCSAKKNHLVSQAHNHTILCALRQNLHALGMQAHLNVEPWTSEFSGQLVWWTSHFWILLR